MSFPLIKSGKIASLWLKNTTPSLTAVRNHWNKDFKPAPYPKTEEERAAAAAKYNLLPVEYEPYPDDGTGMGDYPKLPLESAESRDPFYPWDFPELKRNFNEPLNDEFDLVREDRYNANAKFHVPVWGLWAQFFGAIGITFAMYKICDLFKMFPAVVPPQLPKDGKVHYTFETS